MSETVLPALLPAKFPNGLPAVAAVRSQSILVDDGSKAGVTTIGAVVDLATAGNGVVSELPPEKTVFIGGLGPNLSRMADAGAMAPLLADGRIGLYNHPNGTSLLGATFRSAMWATWAPTGVAADGSGQSVGEVGDAIPVSPGYRTFFGGSYPPQVNMNALTGSGGGTGSYTAVTGDAKPGTVYGNYVTASDLVKVKASIDAAIVAGARNVAVFNTPNGGTEDLDDPFASAAYWANVRAIALYGGGIALDCPAGYFFARNDAYRSMVAQMIRWCRAQGLRSSFTVSPYALAADASGNAGAGGYEGDFLQVVQRMVAYLQARDALPTQWIVETYGVDAQGNPLTENGIGIGRERGSLNEIALYLAEVVPQMPRGTAQPLATGARPESGMQQAAVSRVAVAAPLSGGNAVRLADVKGAGTLAGQDASGVNISGGLISGATEIKGDIPIQTTRTALFLNGAITQGAAAAVYQDGDTAGTLSFSIPGSVTGANLSTKGRIVAQTYEGLSGSPALMRYGLIVQSSGSVSYIVAASSDQTGVQITATDSSAVTLKVQTLSAGNVIGPGTVGATTRVNAVNTVNLDASGAVALSAQLMSINGAPSASPGTPGRVWVDTNGFLRVSQ